MNNFLTDRLVAVNTPSGSSVRASLPETFTLLMRNRVDSFPALRPHQRHPWHAFLVQLGAIATHKAGLTEPPEDSEEWLRLIRGLTPDYPDDEPWSLVVDDIARPAFMQPPASSADRLSDYESTVETPDGLDMLITSKNHDLKSSVASSSETDEWIFALISLQTSEGFGGRDNYGISRMNGGLGCRPAFSLTPSARPGIHLRRDLVALLERRETLLDMEITRDGGIALLWTLPWDGAKVEALVLEDLDPFYIEICRRMRLCAVPGGRLLAIRANSKAARIDSKALKGITGDPWAPINVKESKSLTLAAGGFTYRRTADYLASSDWQWPPLFRPTDAECSPPKPMKLVARGMVRGQGKTEGYHERIIPLKAKVVGAFGRAGGARELGDTARELGDTARERIEEVRKVQRVLRHAVSVFAAGGDTGNVSDEHRARANPWANKLDEIVDADFFEDLQAEFEADDLNERHGIRLNWQRTLVSNARSLLRQAEEALPCPAIQRYRARARAESVFEGRIRGNKGFPELFDQKEGD